VLNIIARQTRLSPFLAGLVFVIGGWCLTGSAGEDPDAKAPDVSFGQGVPGLPPKEGVEFKAKPTAKADGDKVRIEFEVNKATDVAVEIQDANGKVVRHLAAGLLGANAPEPLARDSLRQSLVWDRKDDDGKLVAGPLAAPKSSGDVSAVASAKAEGGCKVRVGLGLGVRYAGENAANATRAFSSLPGVPWDGRNIQRIQDIAAGPDGSIYVLGGYIWNGQKSAFAHLIVLDPEGNYVREVYPPPAAKLRLDPQLPVLKLADGGLILEQEGFYYQSRTIGAQRLAIEPDGKHLLLAMAPRELIRLGSDGSFPEKDVYRPLPPGKSYSWDARANAPGLAMAAAGPDGRTLFAFGQEKPDPKEPGKTVIYRMDLDPAGKPEIFWKGDGKAGSAWTDLAADGAGNLYVADCGANRVVKLNAKGEATELIRTDRPYYVRVHPRDGSLYVLRARAGDLEHATAEKLLKFSADGKELASVDAYQDIRPKGMPAYGPTRLCGMALSVAGKEPVVWLGCTSSDKMVWPRGYVCGLVRVADAGKELRQLPYVDMNSAVWNGTEDPDSLPIAGQRALQRDGYAYRFVGPGLEHERLGGSWLARTDAAGKEVPFPGPDARISSKDRAGGSRIHWMVDEVSSQNELLIRYFKKNPFPEEAHPTYSSQQTDGVDKVRPDGTVVRDFVFGLPESGSRARSVRCDRRGNVYTTEHFFPVGRILPSELEAALAARGHSAFVPRGHSGLSPYGFNCSSLIKISNQGGGFEWKKAAGANPQPVTQEDLLRKPETVWCGPPRAEWRGQCRNVDWIFMGASPYPANLGICLCSGSWLDLDLHDRIFVPDAFRMCVHVLDTEGNLLLRFGRYGNMDDGRGRLAFARPHVVFRGSTDGRIRVMDTQNSRVTILDEVYAAEETVAVP